MTDSQFKAIPFHHKVKEVENLDSSIVIAIISFVGTCIGSIGGILATAKLTNYRLSQLEQKVNAHNNLITRTYELEKNMGIAFEQKKKKKADIEEIKRDIGNLSK